MEKGLLIEKEPRESPLLFYFNIILSLGVLALIVMGITGSFGCMVVYLSIATGALFLLNMFFWTIYWFKVKEKKMEVENF